MEERKVRESCLPKHIMPEQNLRKRTKKEKMKKMKEKKNKRHI